MIPTRSPRGFIALISSIIIAAILMIVVVGGGFLGVYTRFNILDSELKERSASLVDACADTLMTKLANDSTYVGPDTVAVGSEQCQILSSTSSGNNRTFKVQGIYLHSYTNALITFDTTTSAIVSWQEVSTF